MGSMTCPSSCSVATRYLVRLHGGYPRTFPPAPKYNSVIVIGSNGKYGLTNSNSEVVVSPVYDNMYWIDDEKGYLAGCWNKEWSVIDYKGNVIHSLPYNEVGEGKNGIILVKNTNGKWGAVDINDNNRILIPFEYSELFNFNGWTLWAEKSEKCALISINGRILTGYDYNLYRYSKSKSKQNYYEISLENSIHVVKHWIEKRDDDKLRSKYYIDDNGQKYVSINEAMEANRIIRKEDNVIDESLASLFWPNIPDVILQQEYDLNIGIKSDSKVESVSVNVNGNLDRGIKTIESSDYDMTINRTISLSEGENVIKICVTNAAGTTQEEKTIVYRPQGVELPTIEWLDFAATADKKEYQMKLGIKSKTKVEEVNVTVNGIQSRGIKTVPADGYDLTVNRTLALSEGTNHIVVSVRNGDGISTSEKVITYQGINPTPAFNDKRIAFVVGNSHYSNSEMNLANPENDAKDVAEKLKGLGFEVILKLDATLETMDRELSSFKDKAKDYDVAMFYYAGHGIQSKGMNYIIPTNIENLSEDNLKYKCVNMERVLDVMEDSQCKLKIVILDACRNDPVSRKWHRSAGTRGLSIMNAPEGTIISFSTSPGNTALDGTGRNSPYTRAFLNTLDVPNIDVLHFFQKVGASVLDMTKKAQNPWLSVSFTGDFYFNKQ